MTLLPEYRAQLYRAAERRAGRRAGRRATRLTRSWPVAISTVVAVVVVVAAVAVLSHRHAPSTPPRPAPAAPAVSAGRLTSILGVLRRPQTQADRQTWVPGFFDTFASSRCRAANTPLQCSLRLDRPLIRQVVVPGMGYRVGLLPYSSAGRIAGVAITLHGPGVYDLAAGPWTDSTTFPPGLSALRTRGLLLSAYVSNGVNRGAIVVPDGVARVVLGPVHLLDTTITRRFTPTDGASAVVHDNIAMFQLSGLTVQNLELRTGALRRFFSEGSGRECRLTLAIYRLPAVTHMTWLARDGRMVNHALVQFALYVGTHHPTPGTVPLPPRCGASG
jgi:hypothetical protein